MAKYINMAAKQAAKAEQIRDFLEKLSQLTRETGVAIHGCGCHGSPSLEQASDPDELFSTYYRRWVVNSSLVDDLKWNPESESYTVVFDEDAADEDVDEGDEDDDCDDEDHDDYFC